MYAWRIRARRHIYVNAREHTRNTDTNSQIRRYVDGACTQGNRTCPLRHGVANGEIQPATETVISSYSLFYSLSPFLSLSLFPLFLPLSFLPPPLT